MHMPHLGDERASHPGGVMQALGKLSRLALPPLLTAAVVVAVYLSNALISLGQELERNNQLVLGAVQRAEWLDSRRADSTSLYYWDENLIAHMAQIEQHLAATDARQESILHILRRSVCRANPDECP